MGQWDAWDGGIERELREREIDAETSGQHFKETSDER